MSSKFLVDRRGNVAVTFALIISILLLVAGLVVDYAVAVHRKLSLDTALDSALLAAAKAAADAHQRGEKDWQVIGEKAMIVMFRANLPPGTNYVPKSVGVNIKADGGKILATATYTGHSLTTFMSIFGFNEVKLRSTGQATLAMGNYVDISFLIDNSASMGIGKDVASQNKMVAARGCALACHQPDGTTPTISAQQAHDVGAELRIDIVRKGTIAAIKELNAMVQESNKRLRIGLYTFSNGLRTLQAPSTDIASVLSAANSIGLDSSNYGGGTFTSQALQQLNAHLPRGGTGASVSDRLSFVVLFSDGIEDSARMVKQSTGDRHYLDASIHEYSDWWTNPPLRMPTNTWIQAFNPKFCSDLKSSQSSTKGNHTVLAIRVRYMVAPGLATNSAVRHITQTLPPYLEQSFSTCVSDAKDGYVIAGTAAEIEPAFLSIANKILSVKGVVLSR